MRQLICLQLETGASHDFFLWETSLRARPGAFTCCTGIARSWVQHTLRGNTSSFPVANCQDN
eukprot:10626308-Lingulodinium_polyedra.AAC.1